MIRVAAGRKLSEVQRCIAMAATGLIAALSAGSAWAQETGESSSAAALFTAEQARHGEVVFNAHCAACHGTSMFQIFERYPTAEAFYLFISGSMPRHAPGSLSEQEYVDIVTYLMDGVGFEPGDQALPPDRRVLADIVPARVAGE